MPSVTGPFSRIGRYLITEVISPFALGFVAYTFLFLLKSLFDLAELIISNELPIGTVLALFAWSLPHITVITLPVSFLLGLLIGVGRLTSESEMTALRASGVGFGQIFRALLPLACAVLVVDVALTTVVLPMGNRRLQEMKLSILAAKSGQAIRPRVFEPIPGLKTLYVADVDPATSRWLGLFLAERLDPSRDRITIARQGILSSDPGAGKLWLDLLQTGSYETDLAHPEKHQVTLNSRQTLVVSESSRALSDGKQRRRPGLREMTLSQLSEVSKSDPSVSRRREATFEIQKKAAIPAAAIGFLAVGLPIALSNRRGARGSGFAASVGLVALYYVLLTTSENLGVEGRLSPRFAAWIPNLLYFALGAWCFFRLESERGFIPEVFGQGIHWLSARVRSWFERWRLQARARSSVTDRSSRPITRPIESDDESVGQLLRDQRRSGIVLVPDRIEKSSRDWRMLVGPTLIDRYVVSLLVRLLILVIVSFVVLFLIVDYSQEADEILKNRVPSAVVFAYYRVLVLQILHDTAPFSFLIACLVTIGLLSRRHELVAARASGMSLYRLAVPILAVASLLGALAYFYQDGVLPHAGPEISRLKARIKGRQLSKGSTDQRWFAGEGRTILGFRQVETSEGFAGLGRRAGSITGISAFEINPSGDLDRRFEAARAERIEKQWYLTDGWERTYSAGLETGYRRFLGSIPAPFADGLESVTHLASQDLSLRQLAEKVRRLERAGQDVRRMKFQLHFRFSTPFASAILGILAIPFAAKFGRRGTMAGIGLGLLLGMAFFVAVAFFSKLGETGTLPAALAAWSPNVLFSLGGLYSLLGIET